MYLSATLKELQKAHACKDRYEYLKKCLGKGFGEERQFSLLKILDYNGVQDCLWALRATLQNSKFIRVRLAIKFAERVLHIYEARYPGDKRPRKAINAALKYIIEPKKENADAAYAAKANEIKEQEKIIRSILI